jgi:hypothetical protein
MGGILGAITYEYLFLEGGRKIENLISQYKAKPGQVE